MDSQRKRKRGRYECSYCGLNLGKSSYYEHVSLCSTKQTDSNSALELPFNLRTGGGDDSAGLSTNSTLDLDQGKKFICSQ